MSQLPTPFDYDEHRALRAEIDLRITLQNSCLLLLCVVFATFCVTQLVMPAWRFHLAVAFSATAGMLSLFWIHSGARTSQIKTYLVEQLEPRLREGAGWEVWHARHRVAGVLGSRWFISTKGVLVGSQLASAGFAGLLGPPEAIGEVMSLTLAMTGALASAILLRKPRLSPEAHAPSAGARPEDTTGG